MVRITINDINLRIMPTLYYSVTCSFSHRVMQMAENLKVELELKEVSENPDFQAEMIEKGGKEQTPFLVDTEKGVTMFESSDIIDFLRENYAQSKVDVAATKPRVHVGGGVCESCEG